MEIETLELHLSFRQFGVGWRHLAVLGLNYRWAFSVFLCAKLHPWKSDIKISSDQSFSSDFSFFIDFLIVDFYLKAVGQKAVCVKLLYLAI